MWGLVDRKRAGSLRQQRMLFAAGVTMVPFFIQDVVQGGPNAGWMMLARAAWGVELMAAGLVWRRVGPAGQSVLLSISAFVSAPLMAAIVALHGGHTTPYFAWLFALPFCVVALVQEETAAVGIAALTTAACATALLTLNGIGGAELAKWVMSLAMSGGLAFYASVHLRKHRREEDAVLARLAEAEKRSAHAERMATIGTLAGGVAHEINNPLAAVSANLDFLEAEVANPTAPLEELNLVVLEAQVAIQRIKGIVGNLTVFSRESTAGDVEIDLKAVVDEAERLTAERTGHQIGIQSELPADLPKVMGNRRHLAQVFMNLLINAADAINETARTDGQIWIRAARKDGAVTIDVDDNGAGLPEPVLKSLFIPFFTTRAPKRTGLGLATSREYLRRAGGDLSAAQRPEGGARFTVALRAAPAPA